MMQRRMRAGRTRLLMAAALALPLAGLVGSPASAAAAETIWMKVEVRDQGGEHVKVKVNMPLSLIQVVVDSIDKREFMAELESEHPSLDIPRLWKEIRRMPANDFLTVETEDEHIRVWKDDDHFRIDISQKDDEAPSGRIQIPLAIMDYVFESRERTLDFEELVDRLRGHLPLTLVSGRKGDESVKIWLEEE